jgi:hypothetical protein
MKKLNYKAAIPHISAILIFLAVTLVYFSPLIEGKKILQSDIIHYQGISKEIVDYRAKYHEEPLWTNSLFGGMPAYQVSTNYPANLVGYLDNVFTLWLPHPANLVFLYFLGFYILMIAMGVNPWLSILGSLGFGFSSYFFIIIDAGHNSKAHAIGYMAPVLAGLYLVMRRKYLLGAVMTAIFMSLELKANHPQITYYLALLGIILGIFELVNAFRTKSFVQYMKSIGVITIALVFAVLSNITSLWATYEYGKYTIRGKSELSTEKENRTSGLDKRYATDWSYGIAETMTLVIPDFYGGSSNEKLSENSATVKLLKSNNVPEETIRQVTSQPVPWMYWGSQPFTSGPVYIGAIIFFLFVLGLIIVKGPLKWWLLGATILSILLAWGRNFMGFTDFFLTYVPGYNKFRAVSMTLVIAEVAMPILAILALKEFFDPDKDRKQMFRNLQIAFYITAGICLIFALMPTIFLNFTGPNDKSLGLPEWLLPGILDDRKSMLQSDAFRSFAFVLLSALTMWAVLYKKLNIRYAYPILIILMVVDLFAIDKRYLTNDSFTYASKVANPIEATPADAQILADKTDPDFRVLNLTVNTFNDASTSFFHKSIGGYHGAKLRRYQELIDDGIDPNIKEFSNTMSTRNTGVLNMLNTKYIIVPDRSRNPVAFPNPYACGNAWFVKDFKIAADADEELKVVSTINPAETAVIDARFKDELKDYAPGKDTSDNIKLNEYRPNYLAYTTDSKKTGLAVFSEIYYPKGWNAYLDGKPATIFRADYVLRAMVIPAGKHDLKFRFEPQTYYLGEKISLYSSIVLFAFLLLFIFLEIRKVKQA